MEDVAVEEKDTRYDYANLPYGVSEDRQLDFPPHTVVPRELLISMSMIMAGYTD